MSSPSPTVDPTSGQSLTTPVGAATLVNTGANAPTGAAASGTVSGSVSSLQQLKAEAPQVYQAMMMGIAIQICNSSQDSQQRVREMMQEARAEDGP